MYVHFSLRNTLPRCKRQFTFAILIAVTAASTIHLCAVLCVRFDPVIRIRIYIELGALIQGPLNAARRRVQTFRRWFGTSLLTAAQHIHIVRGGYSRYFMNGAINRVQRGVRVPALNARLMLKAIYYEVIMPHWPAPHRGTITVSQGRKKIIDRRRAFPLRGETGNFPEIVISGMSLSTRL